MFKILEKYSLAPQIHYCLVEAPLIARKAKAGQFVIVRVREQGERIPLTIADFDRDKGTIILVFQSLGKTTCLFSQMKAGDNLLDLLGPQGNPTEIENYGHTVVIGGGIGIAPVYPLARSLKEAGNKVSSIIGFRGKEYVFWEDKMRSVSNDLLIATNDGSYGKKGFVTDVLKELMNSDEKIDRVFAIGPAIMMKAVSDMTKVSNIPTIVSLNSSMVCGMGMCGACRVSVGGKTKFTCMDGPDFDGHQVDFEELMKRLDTYKQEEISCKG
ncbi:MAG: sulfide/dihydroorotate dehydrogenase-like FAD/NAD-binding protein [Candidatus Omnitrophota bacterium]|nr:sulfide/dihydroorotate dehydrogenase-like FAD/NAD-binding protein [Candidatus Omnitrophota bacterium]MBU1929722.1 sulfide/dihydroorotate dehydrogenase-like FAD/NAD-binding protein [Candidatus Omnitrophota bacterium]MBU2035120.1 sulfide/dihydroorotate dehydrogenase-like FAD/NAD-binding protein [Candidatus Omnitrophota bacterium]MBU2258164.1 sulfide/dihydroorotate dehydrogenase-like FAD/NAD-binding protein [Candidatus Omnitrophota bacterium]